MQNHVDYTNKHCQQHRQQADFFSKATKQQQKKEKHVKLENV